MEDFSRKRERETEEWLSEGKTITIRPHKKAIILSGDTMKVKDILKSKGGKWNKALSGWVFPSSKKDQISLALMDSNVRLEELEETREEKTQSNEETKQERGESKELDTIIELKTHKNAVLVVGNTLAARNILKNCKGKWNSSLRGWIFSKRRVNEIVQALTIAGHHVVNNVEENEKLHQSSENEKNEEGLVIQD